MKLVTRGSLGPTANTVEDAAAFLQGPLEVDSVYTYRVDLAMSPTTGHDHMGDWLSYGNPVKLRVWCGGSDCERFELLQVIAPVSNVEWLTYELLLQPTIAPCTTLILEAWYAAPPRYFGNILIDHLRFGPDSIPDTPATEVVVPNVLTPNQDGLNDVFEILGGSSPPSVTVFDRWGLAVYRSPAYQNDWRADNVPDGVYFYVVELLAGERLSGYLNILR